MQYFCDGLDLYDVKKFIWNYTRLVKYKRVEGTAALRIQGIGLRRAADRKVKTKERCDVFPRDLQNTVPEK